MSTVYVVQKEWTNSDGWGISSPSVVATYADERKARQRVYMETGQQTALDYGWADVVIPSGLQRWRVVAQDVTE